MEFVRIVGAVIGAAVAAAFLWALATWAVESVTLYRNYGHRPIDLVHAGAAFLGLGALAVLVVWAAPYVLEAVHR